MYIKAYTRNEAMPHVLRILQCSPEVPGGQSQMMVFTASLHWPPLRHGLDSQDTLSGSTHNYMTEYHYRIKISHVRD